MSTNDGGGGLYRTPTGLHRCAIDGCLDRHDFTLGDYLGVGTGKLVRAECLVWAEKMPDGAWVCRQDRA